MCVTFLDLTWGRVYLWDCWNVHLLMTEFDCPEVTMCSVCWQDIKIWLLSNVRTRWIGNFLLCYIQRDVYLCIQEDLKAAAWVQGMEMHAKHDHFWTAISLFLLILFWLLLFWVSKHIATVTSTFLDLPFVEQQNKPLFCMNADRVYFIESTTETIF